MEELLLKDFQPPIASWLFVETKTTGVRIYYEVSINNNSTPGTKLGFRFYALEVKCWSNDGDPEWTPTNTSVECLFHGVAYFDGVRHLYMGMKQTDNEGYLYYPNLDSYKEIFDELQVLEDKYCNK